jgi:hypothetical protein
MDAEIASLNPESALMPDAATVATSSIGLAKPTLLARAAKSLHAHAGLLAVMMFACWFLTPLLRSGFYGDDMANSCTAGLIRLGNGLLKTCIGNHNKEWMDNGRCFPAAVAITYAVHAILFTALPYKGFVLCLVLSNLLEFYYLLRCWKVPPAIAQLGTLSLVLLLQMRQFPDPLLSFTGILPIVAGQLLLSMICLQKYLDSRRLGWLIGSALIYASSLVTYEISYLFLPIYLAMAYAHCGQWKAALAVTRPHWVTVVLLTAFVLGLRFHVAMQADHPYRVNLAANSIVNVLYRQSSAGLPLSYALMSPYRHDCLSPWRLIGRWNNWAMLLAAGVLTLVLGRALGKDMAGQPPPLRLLWAAGLMAWILPGFPIAFSAKYQNWVHFAGIGYLPVYVQYLGVALLVVAGLLWLAAKYPRCRRQLALALVAANASVAMIQFDTNRNVVDMLEASVDSGGRMNMEAALSAGVADLVPEGATIITTQWHPWLFDGPPLSSGLFTQFLRRRVYVVNRDPGPHKARPLSRQLLDKQLTRLTAPSFVTVERTLDRKSGYVLVGALEPASNGSEHEKLGTRVFRLFVRGTLASSADAVARICVTALPLDAPTEPECLDLQHLAPQCIRLSHLTRVRCGAGWAVYEGSFPQTADVATVALSSGEAMAGRPALPDLVKGRPLALTSPLAKERL